MTFVKNGYFFSGIIRKTRRRYGLSSSSQALYYELVAIANEEGWPDTFKCSNGELESSLRISGNTLKVVRNELIQGGLINYKSGKSKREFSEYGLTVSDFDTKADPNPGTNAGTNPAPNPGTNPADYNKLKEKLKSEVIEYEPLYDFFKTTKNYRSALEQQKLTEHEVIDYFEIFYNSKIDVGEFNNRSKEDIVRHFGFWLPQYLSIQANAAKEKSSAKKERAAERGPAAVIEKFTNIKMRGSS